MMDMMGATSFLSKSRGIKNLSLRIISIVSRFGLTSGKFDRLLRKFGEVTAGLGCTPTFAITAVTLKRNPDIARELSRRGVEFAVHGYIHTDYGVMPLEQQSRHFQRAADTFVKCGVPFTGFRAPFLRTNDRTPEALRRLGFAYDSSRTIHWDVLEPSRYPDDMWREYERLLGFYQSRRSGDYTALPRYDDGFIQIPVSIPDDEALAERLGFSSGKAIAEVWGAMFGKIHERGELFTLQLHPERIALCEDAMTEVVRRAKLSAPPVWITTLREIAGWWREKSRFKLEIGRDAPGRYSVKASCSDRATVLIKNGRASVPATNWWGDYKSVDSRDFIFASLARPVIGIAPNTAPAAEAFLCQEGYVTETAEGPGDHAVYLNDLQRFGEADEKPLVEKIERSGAPLVRYWRWPDRARSALSVTGDIDATTLIDFALRVLENWRQKGRNRRESGR